MADKTIKFLLVGEDKSASRTLRDVGDSADKARTKLDGIGQVAAGSLLADFARDAGQAIVEFGKDSVGAYMEAQASQRQLEDAYARFPAVVDVPIEKMRELNDAIQAKTGADADDLAASQATLAQYGLTGKQIADLTPLLDDYAVKTGKDLPSAAEDLGKAMLGQGKALKGVGIDFADAGSVGANFDQVMGGLRTQVGGFATQEAGSAEGALRKLKTEFGDVQESVGEKLLPALVGAGQALLGFIDFVQQNSGVLAGLAAGLGIVVAGMVALNAQQAIMAAGGIVNFIRAWAAQQAILNVIMSANPIAIVVIAIAALVAGLIIAYNTSEDFRRVVDGVFQAVGAVGAWLWNNALAPAFRGIVGGFAWVMDGLANMLDALGKVPGFEWASGAAAKLRDMAAGARDAAASIRDIPSEATSTVRITVTGMDNLAAAVRMVRTVAGQTTVTTGVGNMVARAGGGLISGPGTGTSDSILARVSDGEYVVRAAATRSVGTAAMDYINMTGRLPGFAGGGQVGAPASGGGVAVVTVDAIAKAVRQALDHLELRVTGVIDQVADVLGGDVLVGYGEA